MSEVFTFEGNIEERVTEVRKPTVSRKFVQLDLSDERVQDVVGRIQRAITSKFTDAEFATYIGTKPLGVYIDVFTAGDEFRGILQVLDDRLGNLHIAAGVDVCVVPRIKTEPLAA